MCIIDLKRQAQRGLTLGEMWLALAVSGMVLAALFGFTIYTSKSFAGLANYVDLEQKSQYALDYMTREIRQADCLLSYTTTSLRGQTITNSVTFLDSASQPFTYTYNNDVLLRTKAGITTLMLTNCDFLTFQLFQRNPVPGSYGQYPTGSTATNCKLVSVSWVCSRSILGSRLNTESVQTAKIVMRKERVKWVMQP